MLKNPIVLVITGPCGVGKTTLSEIVCEAYGFTLLNGDLIKDNLFPEVSNITQYPAKLTKVKEVIYEESMRCFNQGHSVVIDYVILGERYIKKYQKAFEGQLIFIVLLPQRKVIYHRDKLRNCWTSGEKTIDELYTKYQYLTNLIGPENYVDSEGELPEQTFQKLKKRIEQYV